MTKKVQVKSIVKTAVKTTDAEMVLFGNRIKEIRQTLKLNQKDFANTIGISNSFLSEVEAGRTKVGQDFLLNIVNIFSVNPLYILSGIGKMFMEHEKEEGNETKKNFDIEEIYTGPDSILVNKMLRDIRKSTLLRFAVLEHYQRYSFQYKDIINSPSDS